MGHENPTILRHAEASGGSHAVGDVLRPRARSRPSPVHTRSTWRWSAPTSRSRRVSWTRCWRRARARSDPPGPARDRVEQGVRALAARRGRARGGAALVSSEAGASSTGDGLLRRAPGRGQALGTDRRQGRQGDGTAPGRPRRGAGLRAQRCSRGAERRSRCCIEEKIAGPSSRSRRSATGARRLSALHLRLSVPLRRRRGAGDRRDGLALDGGPTLAVHDGRALRASVLDHRAGDRAPGARAGGISPAS